MGVMKPLDTAIEYAGGVTKLAKALGVGQSVISNWRKRASLIDAPLCSEIERITNGAVTRQALRPDDWKIIWPELVRKSQRRTANPTLIPGRPIDGATVRETIGKTRRVGDYEDRKK